MNPVWVPEGYKSPLNIRETEVAIKCVKDFIATSVSHLNKMCKRFF